MQNKEQMLLPNHNRLILGRPSLTKYNSLLIPHILKVIQSGESLLIADPDDFILNKTGNILAKNEYSIISINMRNPKKSSGWNPLSLPYRAYKIKNYELCMNELIDIATFIMSDDSGIKSQDPFWEVAASDFFVGLALILFREATTENQINIKSIYYMAQSAFSRFSSSTIINEYLGNSNPELEKIRHSMSTILAAPHETRQSILSVFYQRLRALTSKDIFLDTLCINEFEIEHIVQNKKIAIFLCYEDESTYNLSLIKIFIKQVFEEIVKRNGAFGDNQKRFHFIFTDFISLGFIPEIERFIIAGNKHAINFFIDISSINLLKKIYGNDVAEFLLDYCQDWIVMRSKEEEILKKVEKLVNAIQKNNVALKSPYYLLENEILLIQETEEPNVVTIDYNDYEKEEYHFSPVYNVTEDSIDVFDLEQLVKNCKRNELLQKFSDGQEAPVREDEKHSVDELINRIDRKIAELELSEEIKKARG